MAKQVGLGIGGKGAGIPGFMFGGALGMALDYMVQGQNDDDMKGIIQWGGSAVTAMAGFLAKSPLITAMGVGMFAGTAYTKIISERLGLPRYFITDPGAGGTLRPGTAKLSETFGQLKLPFGPKPSEAPPLRFLKPAAAPKLQSRFNPKTMRRPIRRAQLGQLTMPPIKFGARAVATDINDEHAMGSTDDILNSYYGASVYGGSGELPAEQMRLMEIASGEVWAPPVPAPVQPVP